ncbi:MAG: hypothetical protein M1812_004347 [Candelaria pacifica]|nr:MAG: hypothetical protein M1812_004347 [Candelaria pacifica]
MVFLTTCLTVVATAILSLSSIANAGPVSTCPQPPPTGCGRALPTQQTKGASFDAQFTTCSTSKRSYRIHIPLQYDINKPGPLIFSFHGHGKTSSEQEELSQFSNEDWNPNSIVVYPQGLKNEWQGDPDASSDDLTFITELLTKLQSQYCIDPKKIYASGKSNGGGFVGVLACDPKLSTEIAAFAPVSGAFYDNAPVSDCAPQTAPITCNPGRRDIPILEFHGSQDKTIPYSGGLNTRGNGCLPTVPHWVREWSKRDGYGLTNVTTARPDLVSKGTDRATAVTMYEYGTDQKRGIVTHFLTEGLGHTWPSKEKNDDNSDKNPVIAGYDATPIILDFFQKWTLP